MNAIKAHRQAKDVTAYELAKAVKVSPSYVSGIEKGDSIPRWLADKVAAFFGVPVRRLFDRQGDGRYRARGDVTLKVSK